MQALEVLRRQIREVIQRAAGIYPAPLQVTEAHAAGAHADADTTRLPETFAAFNTIQTSGGGWLFMVDVSVVDGPDLIG